jgi:hypothetical protein
MTKRLMILVGCLCLALLTNLSFRVPTDVQAQAACSTGIAPAFTLGTLKTPQFPDGELFFLGAANGLRFTTSSPGASLFALTDANFGSNPGYANTTSLGFAATTPSATATAVSCLDSIWDINFSIAGTGATAGDVINLYFQQADGSGRRDIIQLTVQPGGASAVVTGLLVGATLDAAGHKPAPIGTLVPYVEAAGTAGQRTQLMTVALPMNGTIPNCNQLGVEIRRASGVGTTTVAFVNIVVTRNATTTANGPSVQGNNGTYPTALACPVACPACPVINCDLTICFAAACDWCNRLTWSLHNRRDFWVRVPGLNFGLMVSPYGPFSQNVQQALGCSGYTKNDPYSKMVAEYVAAQLSVQATTPFWYPQLSRQKLACHVTRMLMGNQQRAIPVTLSNGTTLDGNSSLQDLFNATDAIAVKGTIDDYNKLLNIYMQLNNCRKD